MNKDEIFCYVLNVVGLSLITLSIFSLLINSPTLQDDYPFFYFVSAVGVGFVFSSSVGMSIMWGRKNGKE